MFTLTVYRGDRIVQELDLEGSEIAIGRSVDNQVVLADDGKGVSRVHAVLRDENGAYVLSDRNSQNGTFLEGKRVKQAVVQPGQDIVIGPYRLVLSPRDAEAAGTVVASRSAVPVVPPTAQRPTPTPAQIKETTASQTAKAVLGTSSGTPRKSGPSPSMLYGIGGLAVALVAALLIWQFWPATPPEVTVVSQTTTTTIPATTSIPEVPADPHAQRIADAESAFTAAELTFEQKAYAAAATAFDAIIANFVAPVLSVDPQHAPALDLQTRATAKAAEARRLDKLASRPAPVVKLVDPNAVVRRPNETDQDYDLRNNVAQKDYAYGRERFSAGDLVTAVEIFEGLATREPGWRDVSTYLKNSQEALDEARREAQNDGLRLEKAGFDALNDRRFEAAATAFMGAAKEFERAATLRAPEVAKLVAENLDRRRQLAKEALQSARTQANYRNRAEATKLFRVVIDVLPPGDALRLAAEADLIKLGAGGE